MRAEAFIEARNRGQLHQLLLREFIASGMTQAELARRTEKPRETISRVLGHPNNLEINTASKLLYAISGKALAFDAYDPLASASGSSNRDHRPDWSDPPIEKLPKPTDMRSSGSSASTAAVSPVQYDRVPA